MIDDAKLLRAELIKVAVKRARMEGARAAWIYTADQAAVVNYIMTRVGEGAAPISSVPKKDGAKDSGGNNRGGIEKNDSLLFSRFFAQIMDRPAIQTIWNFLTHPGTVVGALIVLGGCALHILNELFLKHWPTFLFLWFFMPVVALWLKTKRINTGCSISTLKTIRGFLIICVALISCLFLSRSQWFQDSNPMHYTGPWYIEVVLGLGVCLFWVTFMAALGGLPYLTWRAASEAIEYAALEDTHRKLNNKTVSSRLVYTSHLSIAQMSIARDGDGSYSVLTKFLVKPELNGFGFLEAKGLPDMHAAANNFWDIEDRLLDLAKSWSLEAEVRENAGKLPAELQLEGEHATEKAQQDITMLAQEIKIEGVGEFQILRREATPFEKVQGVYGIYEITGPALQEHAERIKSFQNAPPLVGIPDLEAAENIASEYGKFIKADIKARPEVPGPVAGALPT